ncbi:MAG TPA: SDR family NAD(P)-dependent oxidoreductase [Spirochaetia bacterium]|nr:SDR family NAD(P)-dependent oxidoreductase [Spirochaetia bacterium]
MAKLLEGKATIVTGAAQGIGFAIAKEMALHGCGVLGCDLNAEKLDSAFKTIADLSGGKAIGMRADVGSKNDVEAVVKRGIEEFGGIDILVNNAGILIHAPVLEMREEDWDRIFQVNVKGFFLFAQAVGRRMVQQGRGKIINISSCSAKKPTLHEGAYSATKAAILGLNRVLAWELGPHGVTVNAILPGATDTEMVRSAFLTTPEIEQEWIEKTALKRLGTPRDQAKVAVFLASELADHITGEAIVVSAGEMMSQ